MCGYFCIEFINYMLKGKTLDYTNLFSPNDFKRTIELLKEYLRMNNIIELTDTTNKYRLDEINKIRDYFNNEIKERKDTIKKLNKYLISFDMQSLCRKNKGTKYLLCAIDLHSKYAFVIPLKDKKGISIVNAFNKIIKKSNRKPNKIWVDQGGEFYNVFEKWLSDNDINKYSTYNEGKSVVSERFIRTLKNKLYKHMTATGKNVYYDVLDDVVNKYNNTKHSTIEMKPIDVKNNKS